LKRIGFEMIGFFKKYFKSKPSKETEIQESIILKSTDIQKYFDPECKLFRYSKFLYYIDEKDELYEHIEGFHTIPVAEEKSFEDAAAMSISFKDDYEQYEKKLILHQYLRNPQLGTRGSTYKWQFEDGSLLTSLISSKFE